MAQDINNTVQNFLKTPTGAKLSDKQTELNQLLESPDGQTVKKILSGEEGAVMAAIESGDISTLKAKLSEILKTEEGARLAAQLSQMMK